MITLITFPPTFGEPSASSFCTKAIYLLNMAGVDWERQDTNDPRKWPKAKLPAITVDGRTIGDSNGIRLYLESLGIDLEPGLSDLDKSTAQSMIRMAEEHMYFHVVMDRWGNDDVWPIVRDTYFKDIPKIPRLIVTRGLRKKLMKGMHAQGLGRLSAQERMARIEPDLQAITQRLWHGPYLFGDAPSLADVSIAPLLGAMRTTPHPTALRRRIEGDTVLSTYINRVADALG
jgi:glutathione S-transferase